MDINLIKLKFIQDAKESIKNLNESLISDAWDFALKAHGNQKRDSGNYYFEHPISVAKRLFDINCDSETIVAALLHDVVEDTDFGIQNIREKFGDEVAFLVHGVTKIPPLHTIYDTQKARDLSKQKNREASKRESIKKLFNAIISDYRVAIIKLADRLQNLRTLGGIEDQIRRKRIAHESLLIYAPLAGALGYETLQNEIQEPAFRHYEPKIYNELIRKIERKSDQYKYTKMEVIDEIENELEKKNIKAEVYGRKKQAYSIYRKMITQDLEFDEVYDIVGIRVIVNTEEECYHVLAVIQKLGREYKFDDYIQKPRPPFNYRSLHKVFVNKEWGKVEIQIRSFEMHEEAEKGPASHWKYKMRNETLPEIERRLTLLRETLSSIDEQNDSFKDVQEKLNESLKPFITVYTPNHEAIFLPIGATPIDFAYHIHTEVGHRCFAAKVNNKLVRLEHKLSDLDKIEIITKKNEEPKLSWISEGKVTSPKARQKILNYLRKQENIEIRKAGEGLLNRHMKICSNYGMENKILLNKLLNSYKVKSKIELLLRIANDEVSIKKFIKNVGDIILNKVVEETGFPKEFLNELPNNFFLLNKLDDNSKNTLLLSIGSGNVISDELYHIVKNLKIELKKSPERIFKVDNKKQEISDSFLFNIPQCCYPIPGDKITGFVTLGRGISIHRINCPNVIQAKNKLDSKSRFIELTWNDLGIIQDNKYIAEITLTLINEHPSTFKTISEIINVNKGITKNVISLGNPKHRNIQVPVALFVYVDNIAHLTKIINSLSKIEGISTVKRNYQ